MIEAKKLIFLGAPGAGKGTIAGALESKTGLKQISTGDIFRLEIKSKSDLGLKVQELVNSGAYVPDDVTNEIVRKTLSDKELEKTGFILDGYPRTINQADFLDEINVKIDNVILLEAPAETIIERLSGRRVCPTCKKIYHVVHKKPKVANHCDVDNTELIIRKDDMPDQIKVRLEVYNKSTKPLIDYYKEKNKLISFDASVDLSKTVDEIIKRIF